MSADQMRLDAHAGLLEAAQHLADAASLINVHGDIVSRNLAAMGQGFAYGDACLALGHVLRALLDEGEDPRDVHNAMIESGLSVTEAIDECRRTKWGTDLEVQVTVMFRMHSGTDPDEVRNLLAANLEHGGFREGIVEALTYDKLGASYDGAVLTDTEENT